MLQRSASKLLIRMHLRQIMSVANPRTACHVAPNDRVNRMTILDNLVQNFGLSALVASLLIALFAAFVKGAVGFALPMIMIGGLGSFMPAETAVAGLLLPTLVTNIWQVMRGGKGDALAVLRVYWRFNLVFAVTMIASAQLVVVVPDQVLFIILGGIIATFGLLQVVGLRFHFRPAYRHPIEVALAVVSGLIGGMSGVWGPPLILFLLALDVPKAEQIRALGITFLLGSVILVAAHLKSGVLNAQTLPFSALLLVPAALGMVLGYAAHDRMDQELFRKLTLVVLVFAGLNLLRRGIFG